MNLKKNLGRVATAFLATAMLASLTAVPVSADPIENPDLGTGGDGSAGSATISSINGEDILGEANGNALTEMEFKKVLMLPDDVAIPDVTFTFTLRPATKTEVGADEVLTDDGAPTSHTSTVYPGVAYENAEIDMVPGTEGVQVQVTFGSSDEKDREPAEVPNADSDIANVDMVSKTVEFTGLDEIAFDDAGVYKYILHEEALTGVDADDYMLSGDRIVYVNVERYQDADGDDAYKITGISMVKVDADKTKTDGYIVPLEKTSGKLAKADGNIYNFYLLDPPEDDNDEDGDGDDGTPDDPEGDKDPVDPDDPTDPDYPDDDDPTPRDHNAYITKFVGGAMGNYGDDFTFTVTVNSDKTGKTYNAYYEKYDETTKTWSQDSTTGRANAFTVTAGTPVTNITLSHNERLRISGMSTYDKFGAEETGRGDGYSTQYQVMSDEDQTDPSTGHKVDPVTFEKPATDAEKGQNDIQFTNTRDAVSPTGLAMNVAPYALLVVVAAAGCFVFLRKRREDD